MMNLISRYLRYLFAFFRRERWVAERVELVMRAELPEPTLADASELVGIPTEDKPNRDQLRLKYERARKKHDKFVERKKAPKKERTKGVSRKRAIAIKAEAEKIISNAGTGTMLIVGEHYYSESDDLVLYEESEFSGEYNFRDTILDQLERYWVYLARMRKHDPDSYEFYKILGATLIPPMYTKSLKQDIEEWKGGKREADLVADILKHRTLSPWFKKVRPSFGCVAFATDPHSEKRETELTRMRRAALASKKAKTDLWIPKFMYFTKYRRPPPDVARVGKGGDYYKVTMWWDRMDSDINKMSGGGLKYGRPQELAIHVDSDGNVRALKILSFHNWFWREWRLPMDKNIEEDGVSAEDYTVHLFCEVAARVEQANYSMVRVAVTKEDMTATFGVNVRKLAYFFQDRDIVIDHSGVKKKIFHSVKAHTRADGSAVPFHFRGLRQFPWAGYDVSITVPGRDHLVLAELDIGVDDITLIKKGEKKKYLTERQFAEHLSGWMKRGVGGYQRSHWGRQ